MSEIVENKVKIEGVTYLIRATRKLTLEEMADAVNNRVSSSQFKPATKGDTVTMHYSPQVDKKLPRIR
jgi:hypothetical protein